MRYKRFFVLAKLEFKWGGCARPCMTQPPNRLRTVYSDGRRFPFGVDVSRPSSLTRHRKMQIRFLGWIQVEEHRRHGTLAQNSRRFGKKRDHSRHSPPRIIFRRSGSIVFTAGNICQLSCFLRARGAFWPAVQVPSDVRSLFFFL